MSQVDVSLDGAVWMVNQSTGNNAMWARVKEAAAGGHKIAIKPHASTPPPAPPPPAPSASFSGTGLFTAWSPSVAVRGVGGANWVAVQADPEGGSAEGGVADGLQKLKATGMAVYAWEARPKRGYEAVQAFGAKGYIGQAESEAEARACLALPAMGCPKAVIGDPSSWSQASFDALARNGWDLILEWYWNAQPSYTSPNAHNYPRFANVCFGCYDASGEQAGGRRVSLAQYRQVWHGSYSCYLAETMTEDDWQTLKA